MLALDRTRCSFQQRECAVLRLGSRLLSADLPFMHPWILHSFGKENITHGALQLFPLYLKCNVLSQNNNRIFSFVQYVTKNTY